MKEKLIAGKNQNNQGVSKLRRAQFYENLTKEQYTGAVPKDITTQGASPDTLNPLLNTQRLKSRLQLIEAYRYKHGVMYARWPHFVMQKVGSNLWRYKFNYAVKGLAAFMLYQEYANWKYMDSVAILSL